MKNNQYNRVCMPGLFPQYSMASWVEYPIWVKGSICSCVVWVTCVILEDMVAKIVYLGIPKQD